MFNLRVLTITLSFLIIGFSNYAQTKTEKELINEIIINLQTGDDSAYASLFPKFDHLRQLIYSYSPQDSIQQERIQKLISNQRHLRDFDPIYNEDILGRFNFVRNKADDSGIHWNDILIARYKLDKQRLPKDLIGFELIAPIRMNGFVFIKDVLSRRIYCLAVRDVFLIDDKWYGGLVLNILEANSVPEYEAQLKLEEQEMRRLMVAKANGTLDSVLAVKDSIRESKMKVFYSNEDDDDPETIFKEVIDRKLYQGYFDKEFGVELYIRYIKGGCPDIICDWEAMYRFEDMDDYIVLDVERREDGTFVITEDEVGVMEIKLSGNTFTGTWTSFSDKTEYEVYLKEEDGIKPKKLFKMDKKFEEYKYSNSGW